MQIFDAHFHIIDPQYPLFENNGYLPPHFTVQSYKSKLKNLIIRGGAIVSGSFQKFDQSYLLNALQVLGNNFYGVANIPEDCPKKELDTMARSNITAVRFNLRRGGSASLANLEAISNSLFERYKWHTELYVDSKDLKDLRKTLGNIPPFSIDHLGLSSEGLSELYFWVEKGARVKATGFGRLNFDPVPVMRKIYEINPDSLMFGTDLPSTRATEPFSITDIELITENFDTQEQRRIFLTNAENWYRKNLSV